MVLLSHNQFLTADGVPIAKYNKDDIPCLSDSKIRLAYIVKDPGDEVCNAPFHSSFLFLFRACNLSFF